MTSRLPPTRHLRHGAAWENPKRQARQGEISETNAKPHFSCCSQYKAKIVHILMAHLPQVFDFLVQHPPCVEALYDKQVRVYVILALPSHLGNMWLIKFHPLLHRLILRRKQASSRAAQQRGLRAEVRPRVQLSSATDVPLTQLGLMLSVPQFPSPQECNLPLAQQAFTYSSQTCFHWKYYYSEN